MSRQPIELDPNEIRSADTLRVIIESTHLRPDETVSPVYPGGVGAVLWGGNGVIDLWLAGYSTDCRLLEAALLQFVIDQRLGEKKLIVYADRLHAGWPRASTPEARMMLEHLKQAQEDGRITIHPEAASKSPWGHRRARQTSEFAQTLSGGWAMEVVASGQPILDPHVQELKVGLPSDDTESF
ncbi:hypothetical protein OF122_18130 [Pelagibacterium flavum]|uniref:Uncharacterized protein n=1 Tax=Pelagibacterium flavum TaxID=2984530 RepID=A0ABY6IMY2_9HYPH|nr:hypothetical protein [Pelagibacterium sp. YIM 151497]UYQ71933.1 hypothetical protein OF122_18130 [Pelagibacterium sp. YIM 151497]